MLITRQLNRIVAPRVTHHIRVPRGQHLRFQSTSSSQPAGRASSSTSNFAIGAAGGLVGAALFSGIYSFTPAGRTASKLNKAVSEANQKYEAAAKALQQNTPSADQTADAIRQYVYAYAAWIPGSRQYLAAAFKDWETVRMNHKDETDAIISDAYKQFQEVSKSELSLDSASRVYDITTELFRRLASLSVDASSDILENHPQLKERFGGSMEQLQSMGENYGSEVKRQVDETYSKVKEIFAGGFSAANLEKAGKLINDKVQQLEKIADDAWKSGLDEAKPYFDKNPKAKELIENNADALKQGNVKELFDKIRSTTESNGIEDLENYVEKKVDKFKASQVK